MDKVDQKILNHLMSDARLSARQLGLKLGMSTVTVLTRIKKLEKEKIITGYTALINHEKLGYDLTTVIEVVGKKDKLIELENKLAKIENVCDVYDITGSTDMIIIAKFKNRSEVSEFVKRLYSIPYIENTITHIALNTIKEDFRLT